MNYTNNVVANAVMAWKKAVNAAYNPRGIRIDDKFLGIVMKYDNKQQVVTRLKMDLRGDPDISNISIESGYPVVEMKDLGAFEDCEADAKKIESKIKSIPAIKRVIREWDDRLNAFKLYVEADYR